MQDKIHYTSNTKTGRRDIYITVGLFVFLLLICGSIMFWEQIARLLAVVVVLTALYGGGNILLRLSGGVARLVFAILNSWQDYRLKQAETDKAVLHSLFYTAQSNHNVWISPKIEPKYYPAILPAKASEVIMEQYPTPASLPRLLDVMQSITEPVVFVGPMRSGKTTNAVTVAHSLNLPTLFIARRDETENHYKGMSVYSEERQAGSAARGIEAALQALGNYDKQIIFIDDLINIGLLCNIEPLIVELATQSAAHNKRVFFTVQATDKASMGLGKYGAQLKNNFAVVEIPPPIKGADLQPISHAQIATLYEPGDWKNGDAVSLPGPVSFAPVDPEQQFIEDAQELSNRQLCLKYYGSINGPNYNKLKDRLQMHGIDK